MKQALIVQGGWDGHQPREVADLFGEVLREMEFEVEIANTLDAFVQRDLMSLDLIVPVWTMGEISKEQFEPVNEAVQSGVGLAGCHGGMCDAFRQNTEWQWMTGGQWVAHPGNDGTNHTVNISEPAHPLVAGIADFPVSSEQYYMHVDPAVKVLATTKFPVAPGPHLNNGEVDMPVVWIKMWGRGRVYYNSLGHQANILEMPPVRELMKRGFAWAAAGKHAAKI